jgi:hypothetical protein
VPNSQTAAAPLSGLSFFGLPVEAIPGLSYADFAYGTQYSPEAYAAARPQGTPLLAEPAARVPLAPSAYMRAAIASILAARAGGSDAAASRNATTEDDQRVVAEAHLALSEVTAEAAGGPTAAPAPSPDPGVPASLGLPFGASVVPRPPWLAGALASSLARTSLVGGPPAMPAYSDGEDPVAYVNAGAAFWAGVSPFGWDAAQDGAARSAALGRAVAASTETEPPDFGLGAAGPRPPPPAPPAWLVSAAGSLAALAGKPGTSDPGLYQAPPARLAALLEDKYAAALAPPPADGGRTIVVFTPATAAANLASIDVMSAVEQREI